MATEHKSGNAIIFTSYIQKEISNFLEQRFQGVIPSDAEIVELEKKIAK